jgi:dipeptidyl aminopeptidase/acylaminoacyl peptidase
MYRLFATSAMAALCMTGSGYSQELPPAEAFAIPAIQVPQLSPDGERIAYFSNEGERSAVVILDIVSGDINGAGTTGMKAAHLEWGGDDYVLVEIQQTGRLTNYSARYQFELGSFFAIPADDPGEMRELLRNTANIHPSWLHLSQFYGWDSENGRVIMGAYNTTGEVNSFSNIGGGNRGGAEDPMFNLWSVDPRTGRATRQSRGLADTRGWFAGPDGEAVGRTEFDDLRNVFRLDVQVDGDWSNLLTHEMEFFDIWSAGMPLDGNGLLLRSRNADNGIESLYRVSDGADWRDQPVFSDPVYDINYPIQDPYSLRVVGVVVEEETTRNVWFDETIAAYQDALANALGDDSVQVVSWSEDRTDFILKLDPGNQAPLYMLFDSESSSVSPWASMYPGLHGFDLADRIATSYTARDGTEIPAYLTLPAGEGPFPLVINPHGGPASRDTGGFDSMAHFLASRGYAVLQPNFRGSTGYGWDWEQAGFGQQGTGVMQNDLSDGVQAMIDRGIVDPERVCIVGWSYGGYAALAGATFTPDLYACAASIAGVSDYGRRLSRVAQTSSVESSSVQDLRRRLGLTDAEGSQQLDAVSPAKHAGSVRAPILLIHGEDDLNVRIEQSEYMADALDDVGADYQFVRLDSGDHSMTFYNDHLRVLQEVERFLDTHIGD